MTRGVYHTVKGREYYFLCNGVAMQRILSDNADLALIVDNSDEGVHHLGTTAAALIEGGELVRRHLGYIPGELPTSEEILKDLTAVEAILLRGAVCEAILRSRRSETEDEEIDLGLMELEQKERADKGEGDILNSHVKMGVMAGLTAKEALLSCIGTISEQIDLKVKTLSAGRGII